MHPRPTGHRLDRQRRWCRGHHLKVGQVAGDVEGDKLLTFLFVGALGACSDGVGRKPLIALSALGYATTVLVQARATRSPTSSPPTRLMRLTSCMNAGVVAAFVADATAQDSERPAARSASSRGSRSVEPSSWLPDGCYIIEGWQVPQAHVPAASLQLLSFSLFVTPESAPKSKGIKRDGEPDLVARTIGPLQGKH